MLLTAGPVVVTVLAFQHCMAKRIYCNMPELNKGIRLNHLSPAFQTHLIRQCADAPRISNEKAYSGIIQRTTETCPRDPALEGSAFAQERVSSVKFKVASNVSEIDRLAKPVHAFCGGHKEGIERGYFL